MTGDSDTPGHRRQGRTGSSGSGPNGSGPNGSGRTGRWWNGALSLVVLVGALATGVLLLVPGGREQLALSLTHRPEPYVELSFLDVDDQRGCPRVGGRARVGFDVRLHDVAGPLAWTVTVTPTAAGRQVPLTSRGTTGPGPDVRRLVGAPKTRSYDLAVTLTGRPERLLLHCAAPKAP